MQVSDIPESLNPNERLTYLIGAAARQMTDLHYAIGIAWLVQRDPVGVSPENKEYSFAELFADCVEALPRISDPAVREAVTGALSATESARADLASIVQSQWTQNEGESGVWIPVMTGVGLAGRVGAQSRDAASIVEVIEAGKRAWIRLGEVPALTSPFRVGPVNETSLRLARGEFILYADGHSELLNPDDTDKD